MADEEGGAGVLAGNGDGFADVIFEGYLPAIQLDWGFSNNIKRENCARLDKVARQGDVGAFGGRIRRLGDKGGTTAEEDGGG